MASDVAQVTIQKADGSQVTTAVDDLPDGSPLIKEMDTLNNAIGIQVNGKVIKKEQ